MEDKPGEKDGGHPNVLQELPPQPQRAVKMVPSQAKETRRAVSRSMVRRDLYHFPKIQEEADWRKQSLK